MKHRTCRKKNKTTKSIETKESEIISGEQLNMILNQGNRLNKTPSHKSNHADTRKKNHWMYIMQIIRLKMKVLPTAEKGHLLLVTRL